MFYDDNVLFGYRDDDDDDEDMFGFNPMGIGGNYIQLRLMQEMGIQQLQSHRSHHSESSKFVKGWSTYQPDLHEDVLIPVQSSVSMKVAPLFNILDKEFADLIIIREGYKSLVVHQIILASWSNVFKRQFLDERRHLDRTKGEESSNLGQILIISMKFDEEYAAVIDDFISYMYTESIDLSLQTVWAHFHLAIKYEVGMLLILCMQFMHRQLSVLPIRPFLVKQMERVAKIGTTKTVVEIAMLRIQSELFSEDAEIVSSFGVDFLCDVLRSSNVVANNEYAIFQKLKPKMDALKQAGENRQVHRLLAVLRLTQMKTSELRELCSGEYMDEIRKAFPERLESALWTHALFNEQSWDMVPFSIERPRLYLEIPVPYTTGYGRHYYEDEYNDKILEFEQRKFNEMHFKIKDGQQTAEHAPDFDSRYGINPQSHTFPIYEVTTGVHNVKQLTMKCLLEIPSGKFEFVTVHYKLPQLRNKTFKLVMVFCIQTQLETKRRIFTQIDDTTETGVKCHIFPLPITGEDCDISITNAVCYACDHDNVPRITWDEALKVHFVSSNKERIVASAATHDNEPWDGITVDHDLMGSQEAAFNL